MNYWTRIGNVEVQRAGSVYLSSQGFAVPFLILLPAATAWVFGGVKRRTLEVTSTRAPAMGCPSGPTTWPMMMSVLDPT
jgi:hypothetical protein